MKPTKDNNKPEISRKEALKKIGNYGKYTALTALGTYMILNPKKSQSQSPPGAGWGENGLEDGDLFEIE